MRIVRFFRYVRVTRRHRIPLNRHNLRALWIQSDPNWRLSSGFLSDLTDEEWEKFAEAMNIPTGKDPL